MALRSTTSTAGYASSSLFPTRVPRLTFDLRHKPVPLDLLTLANFTDPPTQRGTGLLRGFGGGGNKGDAQANTPGVTPDATDSRVVYPCTILHTGRLGGLYTVYAESSQARTDWKDKLQEAIGLRKVVQESNKVFEVETLSSDTFAVPSLLAAPTNHPWNTDNALTGKVTCSVPFSKQIVSFVCWRILIWGRFAYM